MKSLAGVWGRSPQTFPVRLQHDVARVVAVGQRLFRKELEAVVAEHRQERIKWHAREFAHIVAGTEAAALLAAQVQAAGKLGVVGEGDVLESRFGEKMAKFRILQVAETVRKNDAALMYELLDGEDDL